MCMCEFVCVHVYAYYLAGTPGQWLRTEFCVKARMLPNGILINTQQTGVLREHHEFTHREKTLPLGLPIILDAHAAA